MKKILAFFILHSSFFILLSGQKENNMWYIGQNTNFDNNVIDTGIKKIEGASVLDFNNAPFTVSRKPNTLSLVGNVINMCDSSGNLLFYSNGSKVFNYNHQLIKNGDRLNYSKYWDLRDEGYYGDYIIGNYRKSMLCIPNPYNTSQYYLITTYLDWGRADTFNDERAFIKIMYSVLDMSRENGKGELIVKEKTLAWGNFGWGVFGCKKANGKDWWVFVRDFDSTGCFNKISIDSSGISLVPTKQCLGYKVYSDVDNDSVYAFSSGAFSPNGKKFAFSTWNGLEVFDFNRCTGEFSNPKICDYPYKDTALLLMGIADVCFSPNSKYIYNIDAGTLHDKNTSRIFQFESDATSLCLSRVLVAEYDGFKDHYNGDTTLVGFPTLPSSMQIAPDGKIYMGSGTTTRYLHEIKYPNKKGLACEVKQHNIMLPTYIGAPPYYPNYNLKASKCCHFSINRNLTLRQDSTLVANDTGSYQWYRCGDTMTPIAGATDREYKPSESGSYAVFISNIHCDDTSECVQIEFCDPQVTIAGENYVCSGYKDTIRATVTNAGVNHTLSWYLNGTLISQNINPFIYTPNTGDSIYALVKSANTCFQESTIQSETHIPNINAVNQNVSMTDDYLSIAINGTYQWVYCDSNFKSIPNENQDTFYPKTSGFYAVIVSKNGCIDTSGCYVYAPTSSIINSVSESIIIYPNPVSNKLFVVLDNNNYRKYYFEIFNIIGGINRRGGLEQSIDISSLSNGIYHFTIKDKDGTIIKREKLVVQK